MNITTSNIDLYGDTRQLLDKIDNVSKTIVIEVDVSGPKRSLMELNNLIRIPMEERADDSAMILYFVAGNELTPNDWHGFIDYAKSLPYDTTVVYRGVIYPETLKVLTDFNKIRLDTSVKFLYITEKLSVILNSLLLTPEVFRRFMERWIEVYKLIDRCYIDLPSLKSMGFEFEEM